MYTEKEILEHFGSIPPTKLSDRPTFKRKGKTRLSNHSLGWWRWFYGLSDNDKGIISDLES